MNNISLVNLCGIPASGKTTFCHQLLQYVEENQCPFNVVHIEFDKFVKIPLSEDNEKYFETKAFKRERFQLRWIIQEFINDIQNDRSIERIFELINAEYSNHDFKIKFNLNHPKYIFLIDDNMHYKSMRKEMRNICKEQNIGYLLLYFESSLETALHRNTSRNNTNKLNPRMIENIAVKFEVPLSRKDESNIVRINIDNIETSEKIFENILNEIDESMQHPLQVTSNPLYKPITPSRLHQIDLILRNEISCKIKRLNTSIEKSHFAGIYCKKRKSILQELKLESLDFPTELNDIREYL